MAKTFTLENYLCTLHRGGWFGFDNVTNDNSFKTYANLVIHDDTKSKPSESDCTAGVAALQATWDDNEFQIARKLAYPNVGDQLDLLYHDILNNKLDKTGTWFTKITEVKNTTTFGEILLDGTDGSSTNAGDKVLLG